MGPNPFLRSRLGLATLTLAAGVLLAPSTGRVEEGAEAPARPPEMERRLAAALVAKGPAYRPRTEHLLPDGRPRFTNRLILEDSPYLIQHAHNPVDWYPWGPEAFERARAEGKLVFLSIGYSTCYWCHVMERESFEDLGIAALLNRHFIAIKVDREVRPDLDQVYMTAVQLLAGQGGWPMTSILTPEAETVIGGTYFRPAELRRLLEGVQALWEGRPEELRGQASRVAAAVARVLATDRQAAEVDAGVAERAAATLVTDYDELQGGYGRPPSSPEGPSSTCYSIRPCGPRIGRRRPRHSLPCGPWPGAASTIRSVGASTAMRSTTIGWCPTSRRCSTTRPSSRASTPRPGD